mmetsp:Transcript_36489/g.55002  ORF Transcript_36489/g.55002 Transcript_36489/m.55002 type:complete len:88 (-) Transcript_36489:516-779(-)|eukprot:CAMPEP_0195008686 /NCGR_PEP_ID=MMETSP0326_2-20130528/8655_1 /TAXON_ID=2866 ORGANISM="Crypthecodinium cohnii, Strain Seligo" /NCGR_SAMPLE_ID=MMETSP0326_2 /ASSEMBLY_ACC=CAM_ASM_000348 /LENGTH=87 /DNA_ID=CAMNT_0040016579 /DNA_START=336 /DNA_END=599 /DNA_ORIENTATION=-
MEAPKSELYTSAAEPANYKKRQVKRLHPVKQTSEGILGVGHTAAQYVTMAMTSPWQMDTTGVDLSATICNQRALQSCNIVTRPPQID